MVLIVATVATPRHLDSRKSTSDVWLEVLDVPRQQPQNPQNIFKMCQKRQKLSKLEYFCFAFTHIAMRPVSLSCLKKEFQGQEMGFNVATFLQRDA